MRKRLEAAVYPLRWWQLALVILLGLAWPLLIIGPWLACWLVGCAR